ncbi:MAG TPA: YjgN family protein, partial [Tahibacter sp.]|nr:YjgN family protein [Tahibacter sp.]
MDEIVETPLQDAPVAAPPAATLPMPHRFTFSGDAREYFRIWIVNLALGIVTLGVYSAWAKVRTQRYFYSHTRLAGSPFEYLAQPLPILKGRIIAVVLFGGYLLSSEFMPVVSLVLLVVISLATPWLVVRGLMFRARYASWRGLTFRFVGDYASAIRYFFLMYLLVPLTLGTIYPYVKFKQKQFVVENHRFGGKRFAFTDDTSLLYGPYVIAAVGVISSMLALVFLGTPLLMSMGAHADPDIATARAEWFGYAYVGVMYLSYFVAWTFLSARVTNLVYDHASLDGHR